MEHPASQMEIDAFANHLIAMGLLDQRSATDAYEKAAKEHTPYPIYLSKNQLVDPAKIANSVAEYFNLPLYDLDVHNNDFIPTEFLELEAVQKHYALPILRESDRLLVAVVDPSIPEIREISFMSGCKVEMVVVNAQQLSKKTDSLVAAEGTQFEEEGEDVEDLDIAAVGEYETEEDQNIAAEDINSTPVVRFVNKMLMDAIRSKCSDIHFEPFDKLYRVRFRKDGILYEASRPPKKLMSSIVARLKIMANLDISQRRTPQDGRMKLPIKGRKQAIDFRVSTCPTLYGEKVVMRILDSSVMPLDLDVLGMTPAQKECYMTAIKKPQGMILVTGPTGSGKTVTLYSALNILNSVEKNISTIEDPVEIYLEGINQVQVNVKTGMTFSNVLRSFLRQDPDIMMVGEIRDFETADIAVKAAQTGHLVLATLHTNDAAITILRLANMGIQPFNIAGSVILVMAQRLVRKLCSLCKKTVDVPKETLIQEGFTEEQASKCKLYTAVGCSECSNGFAGRIGIYEVMPISEVIQEIILQEGSASDIAHQAEKEGVLSLRQSGIKLIVNGTTSLEEVVRVTTQ